MNVCLSCNIWIHRCAPILFVAWLVCLCNTCCASIVSLFLRTSKKCCYRSTTVCVERFTSFSLQHEVLAFLLWIFEELVSAHYLSLSSHFVTCIGAASARTLQKTANFLNSLQVAVRQLVKGTQILCCCNIKTYTGIICRTKLHFCRQRNFNHFVPIAIIV